MPYNLLKVYMIKILKLISGEEIIGTVKEELDGLVVEKPCYIQLVPSRTNPEEPSLALVPYAAYTEEHKITLDKSSVVWSEKPLKELYNRYSSIFGKGLVLPT